MVEIIRNLVISLVAMVLVFSAVELLLPEGPTRGYARFVCGLLMMLLILKPLSSLLDMEALQAELTGLFEQAVGGV